jgi:N-acetylmuramoyl-L-alanine amidase
MPLQELPVPAAVAVHRPNPAPLIAVDPGHSGRYIRGRESTTGLRDIDYPNYPEIFETFDVSICVARALREDGYRVILTKKRALDSVSLAARARIANKNKAALAISVHNDHGVGSRFQATYDQRGLKGPNGRYHAMYRGRGSHRTVFAQPGVAKKSQRYARIIAAARSKSQRRKVSVAENLFDGRAPLEPGNLAIVQLLANVPWVYNEMGARTGRTVYQATSINSELRYARGLVAGVEAAIPRPSGARRTRMTTQWLRRCLTHQVEPSPGKYTRPRAYLPLGY